MRLAIRKRLALSLRLFMLLILTLMGGQAQRPSPSSNARPITDHQELENLTQLMNGLAEPHGFTCQEGATADERDASAPLDRLRDEPGFTLERTQELHLAFLPRLKVLRLVLQVGPVQWWAQCAARAAQPGRT